MAGIATAFETGRRDHGDGFAPEAIGIPMNKVSCDDFYFRATSISKKKPCPIRRAYRVAVRRSAAIF
jgi:hypothetical protein